KHDVIIVGGGIGGSTLAAILARHEVRVLMIEASGHPRFAIGESTVPETIMGLRNLALRYDVPEIGDLSAHGTLSKKVSSGSGVKRNFSFVYHQDGARSKPTEYNQYPTWGPPIGPDSHFFRQDVDAYMYQVALSYGTKGLTHTAVTDVVFGADKVTVHTESQGEFEAKYLVDAGGMRSILGETLDLRIDPPYRTRSRTIFSHFTGVRPFDDVVETDARTGAISPFSQGTLHHLFEGGWAWVIPFDNYLGSTSRLCSVGINLDVDRYPMDPELTPEQEFWKHVDRFPDFRAQMAQAAAVRPYTASRRSQFASKQVVGDRWCLLPHASDFIDPLFSSGLAVTVMILNALGHRLIDAVRNNNFATERFAYIQEWTKRSFDYYDKLVSASYTSFDSFDLWNAWFRVWTIGTLYGVNGQMEASFDFSKSSNRSAFQVLETRPYRGIQGVDNATISTMFSQSLAAIDEYQGGLIDSAEAQDRIYGALRESGLIPRFWNTLDAADQCPSGPFTLLSMSRILAWGKYQSPEHVRGQYFKSGFGPVMKEAAKFYGTTVKV
ncbi:MAG: NAD(P)/FAD-dependent oxidoreductase, partial [[Mycobacterium] stephanolepidis]